MEKKAYIKPQMEVIELESETMMLTASNEVDVRDETTEEDAWMTNRRRGTWGNLWADNEKE